MTNRQLPEDPEILPPGHTDLREMESRLRGAVFKDGYSSQRVYVSRIGPLGLVPLVLLGGVFAALFFIFAVSAFFILVPIAGFMLAAALLSGLLRGRWPGPR